MAGAEDELPYGGARRILPARSLPAAAYAVVVAVLLLDARGITKGTSDMNRRFKKLLIAPAVATVAGVTWAAMASSAPPDPTTGQFQIVASTSTVTVNCPAPSVAGSTVTAVQFTVVPVPVVSETPPAGSTGGVTNISGYSVDLGVLGGTQFMPVNGDLTVPAGTPVTCPAALPGSQPQVVSALAVFAPTNMTFGGASTVTVTVNFLAVPSGPS